MLWARPFYLPNGWVANAPKTNVTSLPCLFKGEGKGLKFTYIFLLCLKFKDCFLYYFEITHKLHLFLTASRCCFCQELSCLHYLNFKMPLVRLSRIVRRKRKVSWARILIFRKNLREVAWHSTVEFPNKKEKICAF